MLFTSKLQQQVLLCTLLIASFFTAQVFAQAPLLSYEVDNNGSSYTRYRIDYGDETTQLNDVIGVSFMVEYTGSFVSGSVDLTGSWMDPDEQSTVVISDDPVLEQVTITISRPASSPVSGYGGIAFLEIDGGVTVVENMDLKMARPIVDAITATPKVYPVPASSHLNIDGADEVKAFRIFDMHGKMVWSANHAVQGIDVSQFENGLYFLQMDTAEGRIEEKVLVAH